MGLTRSAALDYARQGIRINAVNPGNIATEGLDRVFKKVGVTADDVTAMVPMGRIAQAEEVICRRTTSPTDVDRAESDRAATAFLSARVKRLEHLWRFAG